MSMAVHKNNLLLAWAILSTEMTFFSWKCSVDKNITSMEIPFHQSHAHMQVQLYTWAIEPENVGELQEKQFTSPARVRSSIRDLDFADTRNDRSYHPNKVIF